MKPLHQQRFAPIILLLTGLVCCLAIELETRPYQEKPAWMDTTKGLAVFSIVLGSIWLVSGWLYAAAKNLRAQLAAAFRPEASAPRPESPTR